MYWRTQPWHTQDVHPSIPQTSFPWSRTSKKLLHWMLHGSLWSNGTSFYLRKESHIVVKNQIHPLVFCHPNSKVNIQILTFQLLTISPEQLDSPLNKRHSTSRWCSLFSQPERGLLGLERSTPVTVSTVKPSLTPHTISWLVPWAIRLPSHWEDVLRIISPT